MRLGPAIAFGLLAGATASAAAAQSQPLDQLTACRARDGTARLSFIVAGSPCWEVQAPVVSTTDTQGTGLVRFATRASSDVCVMMIQQIPVEASIPTDPGFLELRVAVLDPGGTYAAFGSVPIAPTCGAE